VHQEISVLLSRSYGSYLNIHEGERKGKTIGDHTASGMITNRLIRRLNSKSNLSHSIVKAFGRLDVPKALAPGHLAAAHCL
jgi:hypothetical protein